MKNLKNLLKSVNWIAVEKEKTPVEYRMYAREQDKKASESSNNKNT